MEGPETMETIRPKQAKYTNRTVGVLVRPPLRPRRGSIRLSDMGCSQGQVWIKHQYSGQLNMKMQTLLLFYVISAQTDLSGRTSPP